MENRIYKAELRIIPQHLEYFKDYYIPDMQALHENMPTENPFQEISDLVLSENPDICLTEPEYNTIL